MTVPQKNQLKVARDTMKLSCIGALCLGGPNHKQAIEIIHHLTGRKVTLPVDCTCR